ncbi:MAG: TetR/AcrR family transcriptional regulator [Desulfomonilia bacterium]
MPKAARSKEDIERVRERILDEALAIISEHGFTYFSMRKLASRLSMSATTIYNYYSNKDELYLMILTRGFDMLYTKLAEIEQTTRDPLDTVRRIIRAYVEFGVENSNYYSIMFTADTPKYRDYIGTAIEPIAFFEKETALQLITLGSRMVREIFPGKKTMTEEEARFHTIRLWSTLHGIISLYNSRVLHEVDDHPEKIMESITDDLVKTFVQQLRDSVSPPVHTHLHGELSHA